MSKETLIKLHKHFSFLVNGKFDQQDFKQKFDGKNEDDGGYINMGRITRDKRALIISDAKRNLLEMEEKYPSLKEVKEVKEVKEEKKTIFKEQKEKK